MILEVCEVLTAHYKKYCIIVHIENLTIETVKLVRRFVINFVYSQVFVYSASYNEQCMMLACCETHALKHI